MKLSLCNSAAYTIPRQDIESVTVTCKPFLSKGLDQLPAHPLERSDLSKIAAAALAQTSAWRWSMDPASL
jgi:hypothetical protein